MIYNSKKTSPKNLAKQAIILFVVIFLYNNIDYLGDNAYLKISFLAILCIILFICFNFYLAYNKISKNDYDSEKNKNYSYDFFSSIFNQNKEFNSKQTKEEYSNFHSFDFDTKKDEKYDNKTIVALRVLGLDIKTSENLTLEVIKKARNKQALKYHSDINKNILTDDKMAEVNSAYSFLKEKIKNT